MNNKMSSETPLAKLVQDKRDAAEQRKLAREKAKKRKEQEEKARQRAQKMAARKAKLACEKRRADREKAERERSFRKKRLLSNVLADILIAALAGSSECEISPSTIEIHSELEHMGFELFEQTESTYDEATMAKRLRTITAKLENIDIQLAKARDRLEYYLNDKTILTEIEKRPVWTMASTAAYSFESTFSIFDEFVHRQDILGDEVAYWNELKSKSAWLIKKIHPEFTGQSDNQIDKSILQKLNYWRDKADEHERWLTRHPNLVHELRQFYRDVKVLHSIDGRLQKERADINDKLRSNEKTIVTYASWRKRPTIRSNKSMEYCELNWLISSSAKDLFKKMSEYLVRHANKSAASFLLSVLPDSDKRKIKIGRELFFLPIAVKPKTVTARLKAWGFVARVERGQDPHQAWIKVSW